MLPSGGAAGVCFKGLHAAAKAVVLGLCLNSFGPLVASTRLGRLSRSSPKLLGTTGPWNCCQWGPAVWGGHAGGGDAPVLLPWW